MKFEVVGSWCVSSSILAGPSCRGGSGRHSGRDRFWACLGRRGRRRRGRTRGSGWGGSFCSAGGSGGNADRRFCARRFSSTRGWNGGRGGGGSRESPESGG